jgi:hypothetical protein
VLKPKRPEMQPPEAAALFAFCAFCPLYSDFALSSSQVPQVPQVPPVPDATLPPLAHPFQRLARPHPACRPIVDCRQLADRFGSPIHCTMDRVGRRRGVAAPMSHDRLVENGMFFQPRTRDSQLSVRPS